MYVYVCTFSKKCGLIDFSLGSGEPWQTPPGTFCMDNGDLPPGAAAQRGDGVKAVSAGGVAKGSTPARPADPPAKERGFPGLYSLP